MNLASIPIAVQLWSVRDDVAKDPAATFSAIAEMGYDGVETAGIVGTPREMAAALAAAGLRVEGAHAGVEAFLPDAIDKTVEDYAELGCRRFVVPWIGGKWTETPDAWKRFYAVMNLAAEKLAAQGIELGYHNHAFEFQYQNGMVPAVEMPRFFTSQVKFQYDMGWAYFAGADGLSLLREQAGRVNSIHVKPWKKGDEAPYVGEDDVPWKDVCAAAVSSGADWFVIEHESYADTPMACIRRDVANLRKLLA
jgi:sugar phosphate isomerase/epimerase